MKDRIEQNVEIHNTVLMLVSVVSAGVMVESVFRSWEYWVPPLLILGLIAVWILHVTQYKQAEFRESFYMVFSLALFLYHGVHQSGLYDTVVISSMLMIIAVTLRRRRFLLTILIMYFVIMIVQIVLTANTSGGLDMHDIRRIALHVLTQVCICKALDTVIQSSSRDQAELALRDREKENDKLDMEDFLVNISHELRTPVNVISGMSGLILKREEREDVAAIRDAGMRLSLQIEDIQDYSEIQRGNVSLDVEKYMIVSLLSDIITDYNMRIKKPELDLVVDLDPEVPSVMKGDHRKLGKMIRHLLENAVKFTRQGGVFLSVSMIRRDYGVNLIIEITDTGIGMEQSEIDSVSKGMYQANSSRNRSTGGIGLGLPIVYGFVRKMNGFVTIDSEKERGTTVRISIAQEVIDPTPCLSLGNGCFPNVAFYSIPIGSETARVREFDRNLATDLAAGLRLNLYSASSLKELRQLVDESGITHVFMGSDEYSADPAYFDRLAANGVTVAVSASHDFRLSDDSHVMLLPKPLYGYSVVRILNNDTDTGLPAAGRETEPGSFEGVRALVVDDEPMNLVVAEGLFREYGMIIDTATSGREAIDKFSGNDYDVVFMDHMMPEMDGVEVMKRLRDIAAGKNMVVPMVVLTANAVSGAREMFIREGFDGFISKPVNVTDLEHTMYQIMPGVSLPEKEASHAH